ncbi:DUF3993 domain-containing protein [Aneurinibacillus danicus]|uniref:DUF3993 domain-containing protein n=1 Tax=Aneurinibacillus danicus TaxID=267746 RepID=UPI003531193D
MQVVSNTNATYYDTKLAERNFSLTTMKKRCRWILSGCLVLLFSVVFGTGVEASKETALLHKEQAFSIMKKSAVVQPKLVGPISKKKIYDALLPYFTKNYIEAFIKENFLETEKGLIRK